jgi:hypothetical protein
MDDPAPTPWLVASNHRTFRADDAFDALPEIDWSETQSAGIDIGDRVFLYTTAPTSAITHECIVTDRGIPFELVIDDREFWGDAMSLEARRQRTWMRLRLVHTFSSTERERLSLPELVGAGLKGAPQGRMRVRQPILELIQAVTGASASSITDDLAAEASQANDVDVRRYRDAIARAEYAVPDRFTTATTRGSAQRAFAEAVKRNYGYTCAITGITTREFLVASHIVPWAEDESIRLDPSNGICLSTLVDRAFDTGFLRIDSDTRVSIERERIDDDPALASLLLPFDGRMLRAPTKYPPNPDYLRRRRDNTRVAAASPFTRHDCGRGRPLERARERQSPGSMPVGRAPDRALPARGFRTRPA